MPEGPITRREMDIAASVQKVTTEIVLAIARKARVLTGHRNLTMAGGVALELRGRGRIGPEGHI